MSHYPKVSVIIPTKQSAEFLRECLASIKECEKIYPIIEIIIVDNHSTDDTLKIAREFTTNIYTYGPERTAQVNYGIRRAKGELIYYTASDMTRDKDFILEGVMCINRGYDAVYMSVLTDQRVKHFWGRVKALERETYIGTFIEAARFFKKSVWYELGGFNEDLIGLEEDFQHRLDRMKYKTGRIRAREYHLHEEDSLRNVFKKSYYYGKFMHNYLKTHKGRACKQLSPLRPNMHRFWRHPKLLVGFGIYKLVQYLGGIGGLICGSMEK